MRYGTCPSGGRVRDESNPAAGPCLEKCKGTLRYKEVYR